MTDWLRIVAVARSATLRAGDHGEHHNTGVRRVCHDYPNARTACAA